MATTTHAATGEVAYPPPQRQPYDSRDFTIVGIAILAGTLCALLAQFAHLDKLQPLTGLILIMTIAYCISTNRRAIDRRTVGWGLSLQIVFALIVLKTTVGQRIFHALADAIN